jgi:hypothetical protein
MTFAFEIPSPSQRYALGPSLSRDAGEGMFGLTRCEGPRDGGVWTYACSRVSAPLRPQEWVERGKFAAEMPEKWSF